MKNFLFSIGENVKRYKNFFTVLVVLTVLTIFLAVVTSINFLSSSFSIDLNNISYIKFLKGDCGFVSLVFSLLLSLSIFYLLVLLCCCKKFLIPLGVLFYLYLIYSQIAVLVSVILIYGLLNCVVLILFLILFNIVLITIFLLYLLEILNNVGDNCYFSNCFNLKKSCVLFYYILLCILVLTFCLIISILKSFVLLLVF